MATTTRKVCVHVRTGRVRAYNPVLARHPDIDVMDLPLNKDGKFIHGTTLPVDDDGPYIPDQDRDNPIADAAKEHASRRSRRAARRRAAVVDEAEAETEPEAETETDT